jgi:hypothetical protein
MITASLARWLLLASIVAASCRATLHMDPDQLAPGTVGQPYEALVTVSNNRTPLYGGGITAGALPAGIEIGRVLKGESLPLRGTPTQAGEFSFELTLGCYGTNFPGQTAVKRYVIRILPAP